MKLFRYILIVIVLVLAGCSSGTDEPGTPAGSRKCTLRITLCTETSPEKGSRAGTWGDDYDKELPLPSETGIRFLNFYLVSNDNPTKLSGSPTVCAKERASIRRKYLSMRVCSSSSPTAAQRSPDAS